MDWFITLDKNQYLLVIYQYDNNSYRGNAVLKIPIDSILNKYNELVNFITE